MDEAAGDRRSHQGNASSLAVSASERVKTACAAVESRELLATLPANKLLDVWKFEANLFRFVRVGIDHKRDAKFDCLSDNGQGWIRLLLR